MPPNRGSAAVRAVHDLARALQGAQETAELLQRICESVAETFAFERAAIFRYLEESNEIEPVAVCGLPLERLQAMPKELRARSFTQRAVERRELVFVADVSNDPEAPADIVEQFGLRSVLAMPLMNAGRCLGVLSADRATTQFTLDADDFELLETLGALAAAFLEKAIRHDEMLRLDELKSSFIALASHELRTPVAVVSGISATLHLRGHDLREDQLAELRAALYEQSERTRELVDQLLDLSRLEARSIQIRPERLHVRPRIEKLVLLVAPDRSDDVAVEIEPRLRADVDANALDRVVSNLLLNAFRYGEAPITVVAEQRDRHFRLAVEDRGPGVPPTFVPRLFDRFTRTERSREQAPGAGLGLSIAKSYAHAHGGDLFYEQAKPRGARFELVLPAQPAVR